MDQIIPFRSSVLAYPGGLAGVDLTHPASKNLLMSAVSRGLTFVNLLTAQKNSVYVGTASTANILGSMGVCTFFVSGGANAYWQVAASNNTDNYTMAAIVQFTTISGYQRIIKNDYASSYSMLTLNNGVVEVYQAGDKSSGITVVANVPYFIAVSWPPGATTGINFVVRNLQTGATLTGTGGGGPASSQAISYVSIAEGASTTSAYIATAMYNRAYLPMPVLRAWAQDPWSFWYPQKPDLITMLKTPAAVAVITGGSTLPFMGVG